jgi:hypothetical protein
MGASKFRALAKAGPSLRTASRPLDAGVSWEANLHAAGVCFLSTIENPLEKEFYDVRFWSMRLILSWSLVPILPAESRTSVPILARSVRGEKQVRGPRCSTDASHRLALAAPAK